MKLLHMVVKGSHKLRAHGGKSAHSGNGAHRGLGIGISVVFHWGLHWHRLNIWRNNYFPADWGRHPTATLDTSWCGQGLVNIDLESRRVCPTCISCRRVCGCLFWDVRLWCCETAVWRA